MSSRLVLSIILISPVCSMVHETSELYNCTEPPYHLTSDYAMRNPECSQDWSIGDDTIGTFSDHTPECVNPCMKLSSGQILLDECANISLAIICTNGGSVEHRVHFYGVTVPRVPHSQQNHVSWNHYGAIAAVLLLLVSGVVMFVLWCRNR